MRALLLAGTVALAGCAPGNCDPSQAGLLSGIGCEANGGFAARNQAQQAQLAQDGASARAAQQSQQYEQGRATNAILTRDQARQRLGALDRRTAQLRAQLARQRRSGRASQAQLNEAEAQLAALQRQRGGGATSDAQMRALEDRQRRAAELLGGA